MTVEPPGASRGLGALLVVLLVATLTACGGSDESTAAKASDVAPTTDTVTTTAESPAPTSRTDTGRSKRPADDAGVANSAPSQVAAQRPRSLVLPSSTNVPVHVASTNKQGQLILPEDVRHAGWWDGSSMLGDVLGTVVISAHVDSFSQGLGVFAELLSTHPGQTVRLSSGSLTQTYRIRVAHLVDKETLDSSSPLYSAPTAPRLVLITCGGPYDPARGGYQDNFVVIADPVGGVRRQ